MKLLDHFSRFLADTVNLNTTRFNLLESSLPAVQAAVKAVEYEPAIIGFEIQGSWAHKTIIKPLDNKPFDADLIVFVKPVDQWGAKDYVDKLFDGLAEHPTYKNKLRRYSHCVTIEYAGERKLDITPCVRDRVFTGIDEVSNRQTNSFEQSKPTAYTDWLIERSAISKGNSFRKVTRLMKYLRASKESFTCPSFLLTTLLGMHVLELDRGSTGFSDTPIALKTLIGRLDDWLQQRSVVPEVRNPVLWAEIQSNAWDQDKYSNFRDRIHTYREWVDDAYDETDRVESIGKWRRLFGDEFAADEVIKKAARISEVVTESASVFGAMTSTSIDLVDRVKLVGRQALPASFSRLSHMRRPTWPQAAGPMLQLRVAATLLSSNDVNLHPVASMSPNQRGYSIRFEASQQNGLPLGGDFQVQWRVTNTDKMAAANDDLRGEFYHSERNHSRTERLSYRGVHMVEAFLIRRRDNHLVGVSAPFYVVIE